MSDVKVKAKRNEVILVKTPRDSSINDVLDRTHIWDFADQLSPNQVAVVQTAKNRILIFAGREGFEVNLTAANQLGEKAVIPLSRMGSENEKAQHEGDYDRLHPGDFVIGIGQVVATFVRLSTQRSWKGYVMQLEPRCYEALIAKLKAGETLTQADLAGAANVSMLQIKGSGGFYRRLGTALLGAATILVSLSL